MNSKTVQAAKEGTFFTPTARIIILTCLLVSALAIRLYHISDPPLKFHPTRQYRSALLARAYYFEQLPTLPEWKQQLVERWRHTHGWLEPPIMEYIASLVYRIAGAERLWIPRATAAMIWLLGGIFVFLLASRLSCPDGAVLSVAFYLFLPFGVSASRSFQPDPVMVTLLIVAVYAAVRYLADHADTWYWIGLGACALTPLLKPSGAIVLATSIGALAANQRGVWGALRRRDLWLVALMMAGPMLAYYLYGPGAQMANKIQVFVPELWATGFYWRGWLNKVWSVVGYPALIGAFVGVVLLRPGLTRAIGLGLWLGYILFGLAFAYHAHTHDYYHLFLVPIVALCLGPVGQAVLSVAGRSVPLAWTRPALYVVLMLGLLVSMDRAPWRRKVKSGRAFVTMAEEIGELVGHSARTVYLSRGYGKPLQYHGELAGVSWPSTGEIRAQLRRGNAGLGAPARLEGIVDRISPEFFIVTSMKDFKKQVDLRQLLYNEYPLVANEDVYKVFDMR